MRTQYFTRLFICSLMSGIVQAQTANELLALVPAEVGSVIVIQDQARCAARFAKLHAAFQPDKKVVDNFLEEAHVSSDLLGTLVRFNWKVPATETSRTFHKPLTACIFSTKKPVDLIQSLKAKPQKGCHRYTFQPPADAPDKSPRIRYIARKGAAWIIADDPAAIQTVLQPTTNLLTDIALLEPWTTAHDVCIFVPSRAVQDFFETGLKEMEQDQAAKTSKSAHMLPLLRGFAEGGKTSVRHVALGFDLPEKGGARITARAFFTPGSPWSQLCKDAKAPVSHLLTDLPGETAAIYGGWTAYPALARIFTEIGVTSQEMLTKKTVPAEFKAKVVENAVARERTIESQSVTFRAPVKRGDPLMANLLVVMKLKDTEVFQETNRTAFQLATEQAQLLGTPAPKFTEGVLPEMPSWTADMDLAANLGDLPPAQGQMFCAMLFGGTTMKISMAVVDNHTAVAVVGDAERLKQAITAWKTAPRMTDMPGLKAMDAELSKGSLLSTYLDVKGIRDLAQVVAESFLGPKFPGFPEVEAVPPAGCTVTADGEGVEFQGAVLPETIHALGKLVQTLNAIMTPQGLDKPQQKAAPAKRQGAQKTK